MLITGEEPFHLEYKIEVKSSALNLELLKALEITSQKGSNKDCILKLSTDDKWWYLSLTSHFGSRTDLPAFYRFL